MASTLDIFRESFPAKTKWTVDDIPDLSGKVVIVTGGYAGMYSSPYAASSECLTLIFLSPGIGYETTKVNIPPLSLIVFRNAWAHRFTPISRL